MNLQLEQDWEASTTVASPEKSTKRLALLSWGLWLFSILAILVALAVPVWQQQRYLEKLESQGAWLQTEYDNSWGQHDASLWLEGTVGFPLPLSKQVTGIDFTEYPLNDQTLEMITPWEHLKSLVIQHAPVSAGAMQRLIDQSPALTFLRIIDCPQIPLSWVEAAKKKHPHLKIDYRGTAFLGIRGYDEAEGCLVVHIQPGSSAQTCGLRSGDIIQSFNGEKTTSFQHLIEQIGAHQPGEVVAMVIRRGPESLTLPCELGEWTLDHP